MKNKPHFVIFWQRNNVGGLPEELFPDMITWGYALAPSDRRTGFVDFNTEWKTFELPDSDKLFVRYNFKKQCYEKK